MSSKCPICGFNVNFLFKCEKCGEIRCNSSISNGAKGACGSQKSPSGKPEPAQVGKKCYNCGRGKYIKF